MKTNHLLEGSVIKSLLMIAIPVIFANTLQSVYQLIDTFWVGRLGTDAVAAVSLSFPILFFLTSFAMGFAMAGSIFIAQYNGKKDQKNVNKTAGQTVAFVFLLSLALSILGFFASKTILQFFTQDPAVLIPAVQYLKISFAAITALFMYTIFQSSLRGVGEVKIPMFIILGTVILNFFLDPLFMFGWKFIPPMGVAGVALATLVTEYLSAIIGIILLIKGFAGVKLNLHDLKLEWKWIKKLVKLGFPSSLEHSSRSFGMVLMTIIVASFGTLAIAAYGIGMRILSFIIIPSIGFSIATSALVGNNLGAKQHERTEKISKTGMKVAFTTLTAIGIALFIAAKPVTAFFVPNQPELIIEGTRFLKYMALTFGFIGIQMVIIGTLKAAGKTTTSMFLAMFHTFSLFALSFVLAVPGHLGIKGIWIAYPIANVLAVIVAWYFYQKKTWLHKSLV